MLFGFALLLLLIGVITAEAGKPDMWRIDNTTKERIDPLTDKERIGFTMIGIAFVMFIVCGIGLLF